MSDLQQKPYPQSLIGDTVSMLNLEMLFSAKFFSKVLYNKEYHQITNHLTIPILSIGFINVLT